MNSTSLTRFFGGSPGRVLVQLAVMSFVLGVILSALGVSPFDIVESLQRLALRIYNMGFDAVAWGFRYFLLGAVIVVPVWLVMRLFRLGRRNRLELLGAFASPSGRPGCRRSRRYLRYFSRSSRRAKPPAISAARPSPS